MAMATRRGFVQLTAGGIGAAAFAKCAGAQLPTASPPSVVSMPAARNGACTRRRRFIPTLTWWSSIPSSRSTASAMPASVPRCHRVPMGGVDWPGPDRGHYLVFSDVTMDTQYRFNWDVISG